MKFTLAPKSIRRLRQAFQVFFLLLFMVLTIFFTFSNPRHGLSDLFYRFDPLVALTAMLAGRVFIGALSLAFVTLLLTLVFGRFWCGWICPLGTVLDLLRPRRLWKKGVLKLPHERLRMVKYLLLLFILAGAVFANQTFLFFDPITIMTRTLTTAVWPALGAAVAAAEAFLYQFQFLWTLLDAVHRWLVYPLFKNFQPVFFQAVPVFLLFAAIVGLSSLAERFWCRYICPLGGLLGFISRFSLLRREVKDACTGCAVCSRRCPTGTIDPAKEFRSDPAECTVCYDCAVSCPQGETSFRWQLPFSARDSAWKPAPAQPYDPGRRDALAAIGTAAIWVSLASIEPISKRQPATMIRPPGASEVDFEALCIRCNLCVRACPTQGLQPSFFEGGWQNVFTPRLVPRLGYCNYNCTACGEVCPTGAIPRLSLERKRAAPIGLARIDKNRCLPWAYNIDCIVCEEACPISNKAIQLEEINVINGKGEQVMMKRPYIVKELCIGCGMCEYQCPMGGEAAVRVLAYTEAGGFFPVGE